MADFRCGRSGIANVIELVTNIQQDKCTKNIAVAVLLDVKRVLDNVQHDALF